MSVVLLQIIGSSLLFLHDNEGKAGVWMIDFAKTLRRAEHRLTHRADWQLGNYEDGYLTGLDNVIQVRVAAVPRGEGGGEGGGRGVFLGNVVVNIVCSV